MKTKNLKLVFGKSSVTELNDNQIYTVMGGSSYVCSNCIPDPISDKIREALTNWASDIMKTQNSNLLFKKNSVSELNSEQMKQIQGGTGAGLSPLLPSIVTVNSSILNGSQGEDMQTG